MNPVQPSQEDADSSSQQNLPDAGNSSSQASHQNNLNNAPDYEHFGPNEEIVRVVYQSNQNGSIVGVDATLVGEPSAGQFEVGHHYEQTPGIPIDASSSSVGPSMGDPITLPHEGNASANSTGQQQLSRAGSTLPSVAEESVTGGGRGSVGPHLETGQSGVDVDNTTLRTDELYGNYYGDRNEQQYYDDPSVGEHQQPAYTAQEDSNPVYSTVNKANQQQQQQQHQPLLQQQTIAEDQVLQVADPSLPVYSNTYNQPTGPSSDLPIEADQQTAFQEPAGNVVRHLGPKLSGAHQASFRDDGKENVDDEDIGHLLSRHKAGAVESGSFRHNFRKKLGMSVSTNENDLTAYRQKLLESREAPSGADTLEIEAAHSTASGGGGGGGQSKFKRTHSVSFNVGSSRSNRHSVDIRNLPSYLTHKRASIVDVAKGAMSSLISSLGGSSSGTTGSGGGGGSGGGSNLSGGHRRDSSPDDEPIFEEPIAPTLSLGQRVALVRSSGAEFGTVGWIGQLPDVDDDWIVGVIFDNMIGNCDGAYQGNRYFYARENYAMFVPLSMLTKTDNYIGRPETGTMLSRMSISLKPGQLISIQRSSIRLQHCFLNAPHQRVGHDVRAVSNRLHCQCHNCGPCAHLTKQGRVASMPQFGAHHLSHHTKKKNSLAHAAVEMLAHHHHHFHDEEEHEEEDYKFGDNAAHACNYVRYSCCQQNGAAGHEFLNDCDMVRPELLDNLIHAPKAPHRRSRPRRSRANQRGPARVRAAAATLMIDSIDCMNLVQAPMGDFNEQMGAVLASNQSTLDTTNLTNTLQSSYYGSETTTGGGDGGGYARNETSRDGGSDGVSGGPSGSSRSSSYSSCSSRSSSGSRRDAKSPLPDQLDQAAPQPAYNYYQYDSSTYSRPMGTTGPYGTMDSQFSIMDQRRFIFQRHSSANIGPSYQASEASDDRAASQTSASTTGGLGSGIMRCFRCFRRRDQRRAGRPRKRKLSAKDRMLEYRRKQSTFVPSTLAKPQEDFASHGIIMPSTLVAGLPDMATNHSDYSSCSKSSASSSRSHSPDHFHQTSGQPVGLNETQQQLPQQTVAGSIMNSIPDHNEQLKSTSFAANAAARQQQQQQQQQGDGSRLNYGDYTFGDGYESHKLKSDFSRDSALTDLGYWDTHKTDSSCDTLKQLVDQSINEQVILPEPLTVSLGNNNNNNNNNNPASTTGQRLDLLISPLSTSSSGGDDLCRCNSPASEQVDVSSPTASTADYPDEEDANTNALAREIGNLRLNQDDEKL